MTNPTEQVRFDIRIEAEQALKSLREFNKITKDNGQKIYNFSQLVLSSSKQWGVSWQHALNVYKQLNAEMSKSTGRSVFSKTGGQNLFVGIEKYLSSLESVNRLTNNLNESNKKLPQGIKSAADNMQSLMNHLGTKKGQGFISTFVGNYSSSGAQQQIDLVKNAIKSLSSQTGASFGQVGRVLQTSLGVPAAQATEAIRRINQEAGNTRNRFEDAITGVNAFRIALGVLVSMLIFSVIQAFQEMARGAMKGLVEIEAAMFNIVNAEKRLSEQGVEISVQGTFV